MRYLVALGTAALVLGLGVKILVPNFGVSGGFFVVFVALAIGIFLGRRSVSAKRAPGPTDVGTSRVPPPVVSEPVQSDSLIVWAANREEADRLTSDRYYLLGALMQSGSQEAEPLIEAIDRGEPLSYTVDKDSERGGFKVAVHSGSVQGTAAEPTVSKLVAAIVGEYRDRMMLAEEYQAEINRTEGWTPIGGADHIRSRRAQVESRRAAAQATAALVAMGPAMLEPLIDALEPFVGELRTWHASSRAGLDSAFEAIFSAIGGRDGQTARERYLALMA